MGVWERENHLPVRIHLKSHWTKYSGIEDVDNTKPKMSRRIPLSMYVSVCMCVCTRSSNVYRVKRNKIRQQTYASMMHWIPMHAIHSISTICVHCSARAQQWFSSFVNVIHTASLQHYFSCISIVLRTISLTQCPSSHQLIWTYKSPYRHSFFFAFFHFPLGLNVLCIFCRHFQ